MTADAQLKRTYYFGLVSLLLNAQRNAVPNTWWQGEVLFATAGPVCAATSLYIWDQTLSGVLLSLLQPTTYRSVLSKLLTMGIHEHYAIDWVTDEGIGPWYAFNDLQLFRGMSALARYGPDGPRAFVGAPLAANKTAAQWLDHPLGWARQQRSSRGARP